MSRDEQQTLLATCPGRGVQAEKRESGMVAVGQEPADREQALARMLSWLTWTLQCADPGSTASLPSSYPKILTFTGEPTNHLLEYFLAGFGRPFKHVDEKASYSKWYV